jgi:hypothetical protein
MPADDVVEKTAPPACTVIPEVFAMVIGLATGAITLPA